MPICRKKANRFSLCHRNIHFMSALNIWVAYIQKVIMARVAAVLRAVCLWVFWWLASYCRLHQQAPVWIPVESTALISIITYHGWQSAGKLLPYWGRATIISPSSLVNSLNYIMFHTIDMFGEGLCWIIAWYVCFQSIRLKSRVTGPDYLRWFRQCL